MNGLIDDAWTPQVGDTVAIIDGPFADFDGIVEKVEEETGKIRVRVTFFGRETPVELLKQQIRKVV